MLIQSSLVRKHCMDFARLYLIDALRKDASKRRAVALSSMIFVGFLLLHVFIFHHVISISNFVMFFGIYLGFVLRQLLKEPFGSQVAVSCGIVVALAFVMLSFFFMILL